MSEFEVRPPTEADRPQAKEVAAEVLAHATASRSVRRWGPAMRAGYVDNCLAGEAVVALRKGRVVGMATYRVGRRHPHRGRVSVDVAPAERRRGIASALLAELRQRTGRAPMATHAFVSLPATAAFYRAHGFEVAERALEGTVDPEVAASAKWIDSRAEPVPAGVDVVPPGDEACPHQIALLLDDVYRRTHPWSPPAALTRDEAQAAYLGASIPGTTFAAVEAGRLLGAATLVESPMTNADATGYLCWAGCADDRRLDVLEVLVAACLRTAGRQGRSVEVEVSDLNEPLWRCVSSIPGADLFTDLVTMVGS